MPKTMLERAHAIFELLKSQDGEVYKSILKNVGLDSKSSDVWIALIQFIQSQPPLRVHQAGRHKTVWLEEQ